MFFLTRTPKHSAAMHLAKKETTIGEVVGIRSTLCKIYKEFKPSPLKKCWWTFSCEETIFAAQQGGEMQKYFAGAHLIGTRSSRKQDATLCRQAQKEGKF